MHFGDFFRCLPTSLLVTGHTFSHLSPMWALFMWAIILFFYGFLFTMITFLRICPPLVHQVSHSLAEVTFHTFSHLSPMWILSMWAIKLPFLPEVHSHFLDSCPLLVPQVPHICYAYVNFQPSKVYKTSTLSSHFWPLARDSILLNSLMLIVLTYKRHIRAHSARTPNVYSGWRHLTNY